MVFYYMDVLDSKAVAAPQYGTGIVGLEDIFEHYAYMASAVLYQAVEELALVVGEEFGSVEVEFLFFG